MDTTNPATDAGMDQFTTQYQQMIALNNSSTALARITSDSTGKFSASISPIDSVLIVGVADNESQPFYYSYTIVGGRASSTFVMDMSRGDCFR